MPIDLSSLFSFAFIQRALVVGILVSVCSALLGINLVLRRFSMIGDGLSHVGFGSLALALVLGAEPLAIAIPIVILAAFFMLWLNAHGKMQGDASVAMLSSSALAIGILVTSFSSGLNIDLNSYMFGSILAVSQSDMWISVIVSAVVLVLYLVCYHPMFSITFDEPFAAATGTRASFYNTILSLLTALTVVVGMRLMGTLLISPLIIFPALTAMRVCKSYRGVVICSVATSVLSLVLGLILSFLFSLPTGATIVTVNLVFFLGFSAFSFLRGLQRRSSHPVRTEK
ncbi:MAG: metal ABC transporter permease [Candidatus Methanomethylophilaceae archaeon]|nr:metal ABC transporter permease [Candidatus Methanomethylophilaceae archaeon]